MINLNVQIIGVNTDPIARARLMKARLKLPFLLLSDSERTVMKLYGTRELSTYRSEEGPYDAATLMLIDKNGIIRWIYQNADYRVRAPISLDLAEAKKLQ